ncbi:VOC family protein [Actinokineospora guangxiensis]|uniref:VOC family protein n=1 Tax=Actinokineospora guangxiensis TaxID=1490288 RepID=A0ABW0EEN1_9PSEU
MPGPTALRLTTVLDCPDPVALADFYRRVMDLPVEAREENGGEWVTMETPIGRVAFQRVADYVAPTWPQGPHPQMQHLDFQVADLDAGHERLLGLGVPVLDESHVPDFRVYADPAGHPFCLTR